MKTIKYRESDERPNYLEKPGRRDYKQEFWECAECGQEFHKKERVCSQCGSKNIRCRER